MLQSRPVQTAGEVPTTSLQTKTHCALSDGELYNFVQKGASGGNLMTVQGISKSDCGQAESGEERPFACSVPGCNSPEAFISLWESWRTIVPPKLC